MPAFQLPDDVHCLAGYASKDENGNLIGQLLNPIRVRKASSMAYPLVIRLASPSLIAQRKIERLAHD